MGVHWKLQFLGGIQYIGGNCLKGGLGKFPGLRGDLAENSAVFLRGVGWGDTPMYIMWL